MFVKKLLGVVALSVAVASIVLTGTASAHHGDASGTCVNGEGVITAKFYSFGSHFGNVNVKINGQVVDTFDKDGDFSRTYKPYANGTYSVRAEWAFDNNGNGQVDSGETQGFTETVKISGCEKPVEKCPIPGKTNLPKTDPNCKEDPKCPIVGKESLKKDDPNCKEDEKKCEVAGKTDLPLNDPACKEDELPEELPETGSNAGILIAALSAVTVVGAVAHNLAMRRR